MKPILCLILLLMFLPLCAGRAEETDFMTLTGLGEMFARIDAGESVVSASYSDNAYEQEDNDFTTCDTAEIDAILRSLKLIRVVRRSDEFRTDWYPLLQLTLSDGSVYALRFDWEWLEVEGVNYELEDADEFWGTIDDIATKHHYAGE